METGETVGTGSDQEAGLAILDLTGSGRPVVYRWGHAPWSGEYLVPPPGAETSVEVRLSKGLSVEGTVLQQDGRTPASQVEVRGIQEAVLPGLREMPVDQKTFTEKDGNFRLDGLRPGRVNLEALSRADAGATAKVEVAAGDSRIRITLGALAWVDFLVLDADTGKVPGDGPLEILVAKEGGEKVVFRAFGVGDDPAGRPQRAGEFEVVPGRRYRFRARAPGYALSDLKDVEVPVGESRQTVRFDLKPDPDSMGTLTLNLRSESGKLPEEVWVFHLEEYGHNGSSYRPEGGKVDVPLLPGDHELVIGGFPGVAAVAQDDPFLVAETLRLTLSRGEKASRNVVLRKGGKILLRGPAGFDPGKATLTSSTEVRTVEFTADSDEKGASWLSPPVPAGDWTLDLTVGGVSKRVALLVQVGETVEALVGK